MQLKKIWWCFAIIFPIYVCKYDISYMIHCIWYFFSYHILFYLFHSRFLQIARLCSVSFCTLHGLFHMFQYKVNVQSFFRFLKVMKHLIFSSSHKTIQPVISGLYFFFLIRFIYNYLLITLFYYMYEITFCWIVYKVFQDLKYKYIESQALTRTLAYSPD